MPHLVHKMTKQRLSTMRRSTGASTTSFGAVNLIDETEQVAPKIRINRRNSKNDGTDDSYFNTNYTNYFWSERGFLDAERNLFKDAAAIIEKEYSEKKETLFQHYDSKATLEYY